MKVAHISTFDSFLRANAVLASALQGYGFEGDHYIMLVRSDQITTDQVTELLGDKPKSAKSIEDTITDVLRGGYDWIMLSAENTSCRRFLTAFSKQASASRPLVATLYPGILFRHHVDGFSARSPADLVLLNSRRDQAKYRKLIESLGFTRDNSFGLGPVTAIGAKHHGAPGSKNKVVFFDQPSVPRTREEKAYIFSQLLKLADRHPQFEFCVKLRVGPKQNTLHKGGQNTLRIFDECNSRASGRTLTLIEGSSKDVISQSMLCLSVSSTALMEALACGCPAVSISDFGTDEEYGGAYFLGSGISRSLSEVDPHQAPVAYSEWLADNLGEPDQRLPDLVSEMRRMASSHHTKPHKQITVAPSYGSGSFLEFATATFGERRAIERHYRKPRASVAKRVMSYLTKICHHHGSISQLGASRPPAGEERGQS